MEGGLIVFDDQKIICAAVLHQMTSGVGLGVHRIGGDQASNQRHVLEQRRYHRDLVGLFRNGPLREDTFVQAAEGTEQVQSLRALQGLAVDADQRVLRLICEQPLPEESIERIALNGAQHPLQRALAGRLAPACLGVAPGAQCAQLRLGQLRGDRGQIGQGAPAGEHAERRAGKHGVEPVPAAGRAPLVG